MDERLKDKLEDFLDLLDDVLFERGRDVPEGMFGIDYDAFLDGYHISYVDEDLAPPLNAPMWLTRLPIKLDESGAEKVADALRIMTEDAADVVAVFEERRAMVRALITGSGATLSDIGLHMVSHMHNRTEITVNAYVTMIGEGLKTTTECYNLDGNRRSAGWRNLSIAIKAQKSRAARAETGLLADSVAIGVLAQMDVEHRDALMAFLVSEPLPTTERVGKGGPRDRWTPAQLKRLGHEVPETVEAMSVKDGRLRCRVRLGEHGTWNDGKVTIARLQLPEMAMSSIVGRDVGDVIGHAALKGLGPIRSASQARGMLQIRVDAALLPMAA